MADQDVAVAEAEEVEQEFVAPERGSADELLDAGAHSDLDAMRHSAAHVMAEAVLDLFPGTKLGIGPAIEDGFYYDFDLPRPLTPEDLAAIEARMAESVKADHPFVRRDLPPEEGRAFFAERDQPYKVEILDDLAAKAERDGTPMPPTSVYEHGPFVDLCKGPHVPSTGRSGRSSCSRSRAPTGAATSPARRSSGSTARCGRRRRSSTATCGGARRRRSATTASWASSSTCSRSTTCRRAPPSGTRRAGRSIRPCATRCATCRPGAATRRCTHHRWSPQKLWERSGHWEHYRENMFLFEAEEQTFSLKPMNCPESTYIYRSRVRSYRELPLRLAEYGVLHRNELSGVLSGLTRVRHFVTDDAHIFVRPDQIGSEIQGLMGEIREAYSWFGLEPRLTFGTRPDKALGDPAVWAETEAQMRAELERSGMQYREKPKDGAFYAPKIDIQIEDALGREWQTATIQVDRVMLPERFDLWYVDEHGQQQRPVAIHRAIYGSLERIHRSPDRALRRGVPAMVFAGPGGGDPDRRPSRGGRRGAGRGAPFTGPARRGRRVRQPHAEQDPARPGAKGAGDAGPRRSRDRGPGRHGPSPGRREGRGAGDAGLG